MSLELDSHEFVAKTMTYLEATEIIKDLEGEKSEMELFLSPKDIRKYEMIIDIYETQRESLISKLTTRNHSNLTH